MQEHKFICFTAEELSAIISAALDEKFPPQSVSNNSSSSDLLKTKEAADFLGYKVSTIYRKVSNGELPYMKVEGTNRLRFSKEALIDWIKRGKRKTIDEIKQEAEDYLRNSRKGGMV